MTTFNHKAIEELSNMAILRNHLFTISQNWNVSSGDDSRKLRTLIGKLDKEVMRRALGSDLSSAKKKPAAKASTAKKPAAKKKAASKKGTAAKRSDT